MCGLDLLQSMESRVPCSSHQNALAGASVSGQASIKTPSEELAGQGQPALGPQAAALPLQHALASPWNTPALIQLLPLPASDTAGCKFAGRTLSLAKFGYALTSRLHAAPAMLCTCGGTLQTGYFQQQICDARSWRTCQQRSVCIVVLDDL